ncbi:MAG TPA: hypothetical protein VM925_24545 [Labilithrix sp.]|nr:hypothetical protein [Labilithrix sp.]
MSASPSSVSATRRVVLLLAGLTVLLASVVSALPSCGGPPDKTCYADRVNALGVEEDAGPQRECTNCLQAKNAPKACCDAVGACDEDPSKECAPSFKAAHLCLVEGGPSEESRCKGLLTNDRSKNLYSCMRANCGRECRIPSCDVDPAVVLFANPGCDSCVGGACCEQINKCYGSRRCKLIVECITTHCTRTLGRSMTDLGLVPPEELAAVRNAVCSGQNDVEGGSGPGACLERCLDDFAPSGDGGTADDYSARCDAFEVYACGARAKCGPKCMRPDSGPYSGEEEWPEDLDAPDGSASGDAAGATDAAGE